MTTAAVEALSSHQPALALSYAQKISDLRQAVATRQQIGTAVGVAMERYQLSEDQAFAFLAWLSQDSNLKLREIARRFITSTEAPRSGDGR